MPARLVVQFDRAVTADAAERIIAGYGLNSGGNFCKRPVDIFNKITVLEVGTPYDEEEKWVGLLRKEEGISSVKRCIERRQ